MLAQYQQGGRGLFGWLKKPECSEENHCNLVRNKQNHVDITMCKCRYIGLPDGMGVPNRQAVQRGWVNGNYPFQYTESLLVRLIFEGLPKVSKGAKIRNRYNQVPHLT